MSLSARFLAAVKAQDSFGVRFLSAFCVAFPSLLALGFLIRWIS